MKKMILLLLSITLFFSCEEKEETMQQVIERSMEVATKQSLAMSAALYEKEGIMPRNFNPKNEEFNTSDTKWWCSGFFPGVLWYVYEFGNNDSIHHMAKYYSTRVEPERYNTYDHDIGFQIYCSFGNGFRLTGREDYRDVLKTAGLSATVRYNPTVGAIRSWNWDNNGKWQYPVIIDNMMNLELLMWNYKNTRDSLFYKVAISHADKTLENHFREDNSSYHLVSFDTITGEAHLKQTVQGAYDESVWARGNAWGLYGFTMMYRETGYERYLEIAKGLADMMIQHPNMPMDGIPYWDYNAPKIPNTSRDASAAAIMASALIELSGLVDDTNKKNEYITMAEKQLRTLSSPEYLAEPGTNGNFILKNSVGHYTQNSEVDVAITYADYYFVEALLRYSNLKE